MAREGNLWARIGEACLPVLVDDAAAGRLEITTCEDAPITCGVTALVSDTFVPSAAWCHAGRDRVSGDAPGGMARLTSVTPDHASYATVVQLDVMPVGMRGETQRCTSRSLHELSRKEHAAPAAQPEPTDAAGFAASFEPAIVGGNRICFFVDGFTVVETQHQGHFEGKTHIESVPGRFDCTERCASASQLEAFLAHWTEVYGRYYLPPEPRGVDLFRTPAACAAATNTPPSALTADLCATLGARLR